MISIQNLNVRFAGHVAVDDLTLEVMAGQFMGFLGPNGAGKTTTIRCISGLTRPTQGSIRVHGYDPSRAPVEVLRRIGLVPQKIALYPTLSVLDNLKIFAGMHGLRGARLKDRVAWALATAELENRTSCRVETLSGGMQRRLNLAASLIHNPSIIICDEPTANVDPNSRQQIFNTLRRLHAEGRTILYTTHYMEEVEALCTHVAVMAWGRLLAHDSLAGLLGRPGQGTEFRIVTQGALSLTEVREGLRRGEIDVQSVVAYQRSLEDVFFELTGQSLRGA